MGIDLAIFDMDGTIFTSNTNWSEVRIKLDIKPEETILENIFKNNEFNSKKLILLEEIEWKNTLSAIPVEGVSDFINVLKVRKIKVALVTNNNLKNTRYLLKKFKLSFDLIITREMKMWKPDPAPVIYSIDHFNVDKDNVISFGDSKLDISAYKSAGISDIYIKHNGLKKSLNNEENINFFVNFLGMAEKILYKI